MRAIIKHFGPYNMPVLNQIDYVWHRIDGEMCCFDLRMTLERVESLQSQGIYDAYAAMVNVNELRNRINDTGSMPLWAMTGLIAEMSDNHWFDRYGVRYISRPSNPVADSLMNEPVGSWDEEDNFFLANYFEEI